MPALVFLAGSPLKHVPAAVIPALAGVFALVTMLIAVTAPPVLAGYAIALGGGIYYALLLFVVSNDGTRLRLYAAAMASFPGVLIYAAAGAFPGALFHAETNLLIHIFAPLLYVGLPLALLWIGTTRAEISARFVISAPIVLAAIIVHWIMGTLSS